VHEEFADVDDGSLMRLISNILGGPSQAPFKTIREARDKDALAQSAAARLRTGREAEAVFFENCREILSIVPDKILDMRDSLAGFDFRLHRETPPWLVEVKGLRGSSGTIRFTDLEWRVANRSGNNYVLVVIHSLDNDAGWKTVVNPSATIKSAKRIEHRLTVAWESRFTALSNDREFF
jgi:hypothetical protein